MTNRRSLRVDTARTSRAFQFIPGHVGGRVDSAQPVLRRRTVGNLGKQPAVPPDYIIARNINSEGENGPFTLDPFTGYLGQPVSSAAMLIASYGTQWTTPPYSLSDLVLPTGWRVLDSADVGEKHWWAVACDDPASAGRTFSFSDPQTTGTGLTAVQAWYFYLAGGSGGGWGASRGPAFSGSGVAQYAEVPGDAAVYAQVATLYSCYSGLTVPAGLGLSGWGSGVACTCWPGTNGWTPVDTWMANSPLVTGVATDTTWGGAGWLGFIGSQALSLYWN